MVVPLEAGQICPGCGELKRVSEFTQNRSTVDGFGPGGVGRVSVRRDGLSAEGERVRPVVGPRRVKCSSAPRFLVRSVESGGLLSPLQGQALPAVASGGREGFAGAGSTRAGGLARGAARREAGVDEELGPGSAGCFVRPYVRHAGAVAMSLSTSMYVADGREFPVLGSAYWPVPVVFPSWLNELHVEGLHGGKHRAGAA